MTDHRGLHLKYRVQRTDGLDIAGEKHHGCRLFVLDLDHDPHARTAALAYAEAAAEDRPKLAAELAALALLIEDEGNGR